MQTKKATHVGAHTHICTNQKSPNLISMEWVSESTNNSFNSNNCHTIIQAIVITVMLCVVSMNWLWWKLKIVVSTQCESRKLIDQI